VIFYPHTIAIDEEKVMFARFHLLSKNKTTLTVLAVVMIFGGGGAQATGLLNTKSGGYLVCVNSKTKVVAHPGTSSCPKGSKKLVLGAAGAIGLTGATGLPGRDGTDGKDGKTLWSGVKDPESTWGAPGDMFINSVTKTLFGPKDLTTGWPQGISMVGPAGERGPIGLTGATGPQGPGGGSGPAGATGTTGATGAAGPAGAPGANGTNATIAITELFVCDGPDGDTIADERCKIGMTGPGGGWIFFVDYNDQYPGFNYLEVAPTSCEGRKTWASATTYVVAVAGWAGRAIGAGATNTAAIKAAFPSDTDANNAAYFASACSAGSKSDWFLGSLGEMKLIHDNLQGVGEFLLNTYWSSTEFTMDATKGAVQYFNYGDQAGSPKTILEYVRPVRAF
jgi:hypothetical protein